MIYIKVKGCIANCSLNTELNLPDKGISVIMGPSGSGKTSLLNCIAGINYLEDSIIQVNDTCYQSAKYFMPLHKRKIGYVFQRPYLLPHLTVTCNLFYSFKRSSFKSNHKAFDKIIDLLSIEDMLSKLPHQLSGGQLQRCCIAQALLSNPNLLLLDEPFSAIDQTLKKELLAKLKNYLNENNIPTLYVTHFSEEVYSFADYVILFENGESQDVLTIDEFKKHNTNIKVESIINDEKGYQIILSNGMTATLSELQLKQLKLPS